MSATTSTLYYGFSFADGSAARYAVYFSQRLVKINYCSQAKIVASGTIYLSSPMCAKKQLVLIPGNGVIVFWCFLLAAFFPLLYFKSIDNAMKLADARLLIGLMVLLFCGAANAGWSTSSGKAAKDGGRMRQNAGLPKNSGFANASNELGGQGRSGASQGGAEKNQAGSGKAKLSPEERKALRQQVQDVEQELHRAKK